jgi:hypothetical protein
MSNHQIGTKNVSFLLCAYFYWSLRCVVVVRWWSNTNLIKSLSRVQYIVVNRPAISHRLELLFHGCKASLWFSFTGSHSTGAKQNKNMFRDLNYIAAVVSFSTWQLPMQIFFKGGQSFIFWLPLLFLKPKQLSTKIMHLTYNSETHSQTMTIPSCSTVW